MLDTTARIAIYQLQNGGGERLTDRQHRRIEKKARHQAAAYQRFLDRRAAALSSR